MPPVIVFPDAAALLADHLRGVLDDVHVGTRVPTDRPATFVLVRRLGGVRNTIVSDEPMIGVECWAATDATAHDLAQLCRGHLHALPGAVLAGTVVYRVADVGGPSDLPDPLSDQPRFVFTVSVGMRGAAI